MTQLLFTACMVFLNTGPVAAQHSTPAATQGKQPLLPANQSQQLSLQAKAHALQLSRLRLEMHHKDQQLLLKENDILLLTRQSQLLRAQIAQDGKGRILTYGLVALMALAAGGAAGRVTAGWWKPAR